MTENDRPEPVRLPDGAPQDPTLSFIPRMEGAGDDAAPMTASCLVTWGTEVIVEGETSETPVPTAQAPTYRLHRVLGRGGMGEVWEATQSSLGRLVAVKRAIPRMDGTDTMRTRIFRQEAVIAARLEHPNIVPVHDLGADPTGAPLLAMKLVRGNPWDRALAEDFAALSPEDLLAKHLPVLISVGHAVAFAHAQGIVHRDIKPAQVMTGEFGEALLMDWGLAVQVAAPPERLFDDDMSKLVATRETASNPAGTIALMAPEQTRRDALHIGPWTDVYLLGGTLYYLLTGTFPHEGDSTLAAFTRAAVGDIVDPRIRKPGRAMPDELVELCLHALQKDPDERIGSARAFVQGLQDFLGGATRRRESKSLVESASAALDARPKDYAEFTRIAGIVERALSLWRENPTAPGVLDRAFAAHADAAIGNGDLVLGRSLAERVLDASKRAALLAETDRREELARAQARQRRVLVATSFGLLFVIVIGGAVFAMKLDEQRNIAEENARRATQRAREAKESRADSDELVRFMIVDLSRKLAPLDEELEALKEAAERAADYYANQADHPDRLDAEERFATAEGLGAVAEVLAQQGAAGASLDLGKRAMDFTAMLEGEAGVAARAGAIVSYGQKLRRAGRMDEADAIFLQGIEVARPGASGAAALPFARGLLCHADILLARGRTEEGMEKCLEGLAILRSSIKEDSEDVSSLMLYSWGAAKLVNAYAGLGRSEDALRESAALRALMEPALEKVMRPDSVRMDLVNVYTREGQLLQEAGRFDEALAATEHAIVMARDILTRMPTNLDRQSTLAFAITRKGSILGEMKRFDEALAELQEGLEIRQRLCASDPDNGEFIVRLRGSWQRLSEMYAAAGNLTEAIRMREESLACSRRIQGRDTGPQGPTGVASDLALLSDLKLRNGDPAGARDSAREAVEVIETIKNAPRIGESVLGARLALADALAALDDPSLDAELEVALGFFDKYPGLARSATGLYAKSKILLRLKRPEEARDAAEAAWKAGLRDPEFLEYVAKNSYGFQ